MPSATVVILVITCVHAAALGCVTMLGSQTSVTSKQGFWPQLDGASESAKPMASISCSCGYRMELKINDGQKGALSTIGQESTYKRNQHIVHSVDDLMSTVATNRSARPLRSPDLQREIRES